MTLSDDVSSLVSVSVQLTAMPAARIANLSIRSQAGSEEQALMVGFVIGGRDTAGTKSLLLRGVGPALTGFGVADVLPDPKLELFAAGNKVEENDNWAGSALIAGVATRVGAFAFADAASRDSALYDETLDAGSYTAQISGATGQSGIAMAEIYDADFADRISATSRRLINVSARTEVGAGAGTLIAGFNISGSGNKAVLIRGIGPALGALGVTGALVDPKLELFDGGGARLQENDNWGGTPALSAAFAAAGAFSLASDSKDAALQVSLGPGTYSVQVSGVGGATGNALVEIYELPAGLP